MAEESEHKDLEALWQVVQEQWDSKEAHEAFLAACHERMELGIAAAKYRAVIDSDRNDRKAAAQKRINAIALLATQQLEASREEPSAKIPRWITILAGAVTAGAVGWLAYVLLH